MSDNYRTCQCISCDLDYFTGPAYTDELLCQDCAFSLEGLRKLVVYWSKRTPAINRQLATTHAMKLLEEANEFKDDPSNVVELADVFIAWCVNACWHDHNIMQAIREKMAVNFTRDWHVGDNGVTRHV